MSWERKTVMEQREAFVAAAQSGCETFSAVCQRFGISRKTGYKWLKRAEEGEPFCDRSRTPVHQPLKTAPEMEEMILSVRAENPVWGGRKIKAHLERCGIERVPSAKTCGNILKRNGFISSEESAAHKAYCRFERSQPNELWQTDFKGDFLLKNGVRCFPLTILDDHSRFNIRLEPKTAATGVKESFIQAFQEFGLPDAVLSDNGSQFSGFRGGYTQFERFLMDLNIKPIHGRIRHPQTQGKIERYHRTLKQELLFQQLSDMQEAERMMGYWRWKYNEIRPHSALNMKTPSEVYRPSEREFFQPQKFVYDSGKKVVKVNNWGYIRFGPVQIYLSETMADTHLVVEGNDDGTFWVIYRNFRIAQIDPNVPALMNRNIRKL